MNRIVKNIPNQSTDKRVSKIKVKVKVKNLTGSFKITDIMLQGGSAASSWNGHPSEVRWVFNE